MVVIKDFEMPSNCYDCPFAKNERTNDYGAFCECGILEDYETINLLEHSKSPNCPLVEQEPVLDRIRAEIDEVYEELDGCDPDSLGTFACRIDDILDKYKVDRSVEDGNDD